MRITCLQLLSLPFAKISDLLHDLSASRHLIHYWPQPGEERHERSQEATGSGHDDDLRLIKPDALQDRLSYSLWWGHGSFAHSRHGQVHFLHRACTCSSVSDGAEDQYGTADSCLAIISPQHTSKGNETIFRCRIDFGKREADATSY